MASACQNPMTASQSRLNHAGDPCSTNNEAPLGIRGPAKEKGGMGAALEIQNALGLTGVSR